LQGESQGPDDLGLEQDATAPAENAADLDWARQLATGDPAALARFESEVSPEIAAVLSARGFTPAEIEEVQQWCRAHLLVGDGSGPAAITEYAGRGRLRSWVLVSAVRAALKMKRRGAREAVHDHDALAALADQVSGQPGDPLAELYKERYRDAFRDAFRAAVAELSPRERTLLRLHGLDGLTIDQLGALYGVHRATAARWLERARDAVFAATRREMMRRLDVDRWEAESVLRFIQSRLDVSLGGFAGGSDAG
jgi:RNA polymerase sigma-70 factor, ECF subfamily